MTRIELVGVPKLFLLDEQVSVPRKEINKIGFLNIASKINNSPNLLISMIFLLKKAHIAPIHHDAAIFQDPKCDTYY